MTEAEVRKLRAVIYGECDDYNWEAVRDNWMRPENIEWLQSMAEKEVFYAKN